MNPATNILIAGLLFVAVYLDAPDSYECIAFAIIIALADIAAAIREKTKGT